MVWSTSEQLEVRMEMGRLVNGLAAASGQSQSPFHSGGVGQVPQVRGE